MENPIDYWMYYVCQNRALKRITLNRFKVTIILQIVTYYFYMNR